MSVHTSQESGLWGFSTLYFLLSVSEPGQSPFPRDEEFLSLRRTERLTLVTVICTLPCPQSQIHFCILCSTTGAGRVIKYRALKPAPCAQPPEATASPRVSSNSNLPYHCLPPARPMKGTQTSQQERVQPIQLPGN